MSDKAFVNSYKFENPPALVNLLVNKIKEKLPSVQNQYIQDITTAYSFIITHTIFSK
ncbi:MAG TPA: hypothetical protein LFV90_07210 [Rickettsia endosymbiont of Columbicola hoogstraali]|nr:hypothetical protein [Rickettsia endosymbiont of Columbicola hoogstraali]